MIWIKFILETIPSRRDANGKVTHRAGSPASEANYTLVDDDSIPPPRDGQTDRLNQEVEHALRYFVDAFQGAWVIALPEVERTIY
ncbi:hypothetical protein TWF696_008892 [Orbilia brochopaga]|uniref:Uncharacterized protein n=1 Tax=Orbilia brochopaga TaxID=3140254 RepID=A0AAV9UDN6_9PEZI